MSKKSGKKIKEHGLKLCLDKCHRLKSKIIYLGEMIYAKYRKPDSCRSSAIKNMPIPTNESALQAILGLSIFSGDFIRNMHIL